MTNLKEIEKVAKEFGNDLDLVIKEIKKVQSQKCRFQKQKGRSDYEEKMNELLKRERVLVEARQLLNPKEKSVTMFEQSDVDKLDYDETIKALKSIQSKKTNTRWLTDVEGDNDEYRNAVRIETMLKERRDNMKPTDENHIRKSDVQTIIETIENNKNLSQERIVELLKGLM